MCVFVCVCVHVHVYLCAITVNEMYNYDSMFVDLPIKLFKESIGRLWQTTITK